jgi:peptide/nickel transport system permease protein
MTTTDTRPEAGPARPAATAGARRRRRWRITDVLSAIWLVGLVVAMFVLPLLLHLDSGTMDARARLSGPSWQHLLGTDNYGRDILARTLAGARVSLWIGFGSVTAAAVIGIPIGMAAAYHRGRFDAVTSFVVDVILAFPGLVLALVLASFLGASVTNVLIAILVPMAPVFVRLARAQTMSVAGRDYVEASQVIGTPSLSILRRDVLPNITEAMLAFALVSVGNAILIEGGLSFLGLGVPTTQPSWGSMINYGRDYISQNPLMIAVPSVFMLLTILSLNLLADRYLSGSAAKAAVR